MSSWMTICSWSTLRRRAFLMGMVVPCKHPSWRCILYNQRTLVQEVTHFLKIETHTLKYVYYALPQMAHQISDYKSLILCNKCLLSTYYCPNSPNEVPQLNSNVRSVMDILKSISMSQILHGCPIYYMATLGIILYPEGYSVMETKETGNHSYLVICN